MTAQRQETIWSAVMRALLAIRRDQHSASELDRQAAALLGKPDASKDDYYAKLSALLTDTPLPLTGQKLANYLDFNRMGNLPVAMISSASVDESLALLEAYPGTFFPLHANLSIDRGATVTTLRWRPATDEFQDGLYAYLLLALFRYQAGQRLDFKQACLPKAILPLLKPVSSTSVLASERCALTLENRWLTQSSFYANPALLNALKKNLMPVSGDIMSKRILAIIDACRYPARLRLPEAAAHLGMSEAAVRKDLKMEGVSFSHLLKRAIHDLATQHLLAGNKAQAVSELLGFSDRRAFDRSFKDFTGMSPGQLRQLGSRLRFQRGNQQLSDIVNALPPLPKTVQSILALDDDTMSLGDVVPLIEQDPIFRAHIMAKASRAVFGRAPLSLDEAVSRNLGLGNIKHLAVLFAAQQQLSEQSRFSQVELLTDCMLLSERLPPHIGSRPDNALLLFGLLSLLLLFHQDCIFSERAMGYWQHSINFAEFRQLVKQDMGICLYGASSLMLLKWGMSGEINRQLWTLCDDSKRVADESLHAVPIAHDIAMTQIMPGRDQAHLAPHEALFSDDQRQALVKTLACWNGA